jgi:hypothetical protein
MSETVLDLRNVRYVARIIIMLSTQSYHIISYYACGIIIVLYGSNNDRNHAYVL